MLRLFRRKPKGFTLIELLIVVAIIGILAAIAIPNLLSAQRKAKISKAMADSKTIVTQANLYNNDYNAYPTLALLYSNNYLTHVYDPFGAAPTSQAYGYGIVGDVWALSVGPNSGTSGTPPTTAPSTNVSGTGCLGTVGWSMAYGSVQPSGC